jgi:hypothetical protein
MFRGFAVHPVNGVRRGVGKTFQFADLGGKHFGVVLFVDEAC